MTAQNEGLDLCYEMVRTFQLRFHNPVSDLPIALLPERLQIRYEYMLEELSEFLNAKAIEDQSDAIIDLIYFAIGTLVEMGIAPQRIFEIVHEANMLKLPSNGKPEYNVRNGKVSKPPNWYDPKPKILDEILRQESFNDHLNPNGLSSQRAYTKK